MDEHKHTTIKNLQDLGARITKLEDANSGGRFTGSTYVVEWDTLRELVELPASRPSETNLGRWTYGATGSREKNVKHYQEGTVPEKIWDRYQELRGKLESAVHEFQDQGVTTKRERVRRAAGSRVNVDRVIKGDPICWDTRVRGAKKRLVKLAIRTNYSFQVDEETFARAAALAGAACDVFTALGYGVEIVAVGFCDGHGNWRDEKRKNVEWLVNSITLKHAEEPYDAKRVLCAGLPAIHRDSFFSIMEAFGERDNGYGYNGHDRPPEAAEAHLGYTALIGQRFTLNEDGEVEYEVDTEGVGVHDIIKGIESKARELWPDGLGGR